MKLHWSPRSPFVRKVMIVAHEVGLTDRLECVRTVAATTKPHPELMHDNPLSKIPTLVLDDGTVLYDSRVICEYLDDLHDGPKLFPAPPERDRAAPPGAGRRALDLLLLLRNERERSQPSPVHVAAYSTKKQSVLESLEQEADGLAATPFNIGHVAIGTALSYLDFRYADEDWRTPPAHRKLASPEFCARPSVRATEPVDDS